MVVVAFAQARLEENDFEQIEQLNLEEMLTIDSSKVETLEDVPEIAFDDVEANLGVGNVPDEHFERLAGDQINSGVFLEQELGPSQLNYNLEQTVDINVLALKHIKVPLVLNPNYTVFPGLVVQAAAVRGFAFLGRVFLEYLVVGQQVLGQGFE